MIRTYLHKGLKELHETGRSAKVPANLRKRVTHLLEILDHADNLNDLALPGLYTHPLKGSGPLRHAISVNGPWRITFRLESGDVLQVDLEQYH